MKGVQVEEVMSANHLRFLASGNPSLRGDGNVYVDTVQCTGSGTLPMEPVRGWGSGRVEAGGSEGVLCQDLLGYDLGIFWIQYLFGYLVDNDVNIS